MASPTSVSAAPLPYISAVSMRVIPAWMPTRRASFSRWKVLLFSPRYQVPWPTGPAGVPFADTNFISKSLVSFGRRGWKICCSAARKWFHRAFILAGENEKMQVKKAAEIFMKFGKNNENRVFLPKFVKKSTISFQNAPKHETGVSNPATSFSFFATLEECEKSNGSVCDVCLL